MSTSPTPAPTPGTTTQTTPDGKYTIQTVTTITPVAAAAPPPTSGLLLLPAGVKPTIVDLDDIAGWTGEHDGATSGFASGTTSYPVAIGIRQARAFPSDYTKNGGFRYHVHYATDTAAHSFIYAGDLWFDTAELPAQMELDNNQTDAAQKTYIFGVQCNANDGQWDITMQDTACHWKPSGAKGNPKNWPVKTWLHFEILCHRDEFGNITYDTVYFNGTTQKIGVVLPSARKLSPAWSVGSCLVNLQLGGASAVSGSIRCYGSNMQVARW
jgi:hypothetical protein